MKKIAVLGSTGSIGCQALDVVRCFPERLSVKGIAGWSNLRLLQDQIDEFHPGLVSFRNLNDEAVSLELRGAWPATTEEIACDPDVELVVMAIAGPSGLRPTIAALQGGKSVALASKEAMVMAGPIISHLVRKGARLFPVDSEPSAIWQCLRGEPGDVRRLIITGSGGPFRAWPLESLRAVTPEEALRHPTWRMGKKITVDSATLMNKALEVVESRWMFGVSWESIEVVVHPQSIVHSLVEFKDGSIKAQMGQPDMRSPLQYAMFYPERADHAWDWPLDLAGLGALYFEPLDTERFPCFTIAVDAARAGGTYPAVLCAADDVAVGLFLKGMLGFTEIPLLIQEVLDSHVAGDGTSVEQILAAESWARGRGLELLHKVT